MTNHIKWIVWSSLVLGAQHDGWNPLVQSTSSAQSTEAKREDSGSGRVTRDKQLAKEEIEKTMSTARDRFRHSHDKREKQRAAAILLRFGESDEMYHDFLVDHARAAIESTIPFPTKFEADGRLAKGEYSNEFLTWCKQNNANPEDAAREAVYSLPGDVALLAETADPRAYVLLSKGLKSPNYMIVARSAMGLAYIQDHRAIDNIDAASQRAPKEAAEMIGRALIYFDDIHAQSCARRWIRDPTVYEELKRLAATDRARRREDKSLRVSGE